MQYRRHPHLPHVVESRLDQKVLLKVADLYLGSYIPSLALDFHYSKLIEGCDVEMADSLSSAASKVSADGCVPRVYEETADFYTLKGLLI